ncbi:MAG: hypothetical protein Q8J63_02165 [Candidatus Aquicultor sp.]|nr:hypothetical protein [Candidatus Aquicultor sp.]
MRGTTKRRLLLATALIVVLAPNIIGILALQNGPWTHSPIIRNGQSFIAGAILSRIDLVSIPEGEDLPRLTSLPPAKLSALENGKIAIVSSPNLASLEQPQKADSFVIATIEPLDLVGKSRAAQRELVEAIDDAATAGKIDAIVEATASDALRAGEWGRRSVIRLRAAGVIRCVIFDGAHHVGSLALAPDILIIPVTNHAGETYPAHWFTRDAVPLKLLEEALRDNNIESTIARFPRAGIPIKNRNGMAWLAAQAIRGGAKAGKTAAQSTGKVHRASGTSTRQNNQHNKNSGSGKNSRFVSITVDCENGGTQAVKPRILNELKGKIRPDGRNDREVGRVYLGLTTGNSCFPYKSEATGFDRQELEKYLNKHLPYHIIVLSEPLSVWDIYLKRLSL